MTNFLVKISCLQRLSPLLFSLHSDSNSSLLTLPGMLFKILQTAKQHFSVITMHVISLMCLKHNTALGILHILHKNGYHLVHYVLRHVLLLLLLLYKVARGVVSAKIQILQCDVT